MDESSGSFDSRVWGGPPRVAGIRGAASGTSVALESTVELSLLAVAFVEVAFAQLVSPLEFVLLVSSCLRSSALVPRAL